MEDADLFLELAGIGGVFVGFGALIAVRTSGASPDEVGYMRGVVGFGMLTIVAAIAPVTLSRYDLTAHQLWAASGALVLAGVIILVVVQASTREYRTNLANFPSTRLKALEALASVPLDIALVLGPVIIILGLSPDLEAALYFTLVVLLLLGAGWVLLDLVFSQRRPADP